MSPQKNKYKKEYSFELIRIAQGDLASAKLLSTATGGRVENAIYLGQQAIEKSLKAVLCYIEQPILHTHDLDVIIALLPDTHKPPSAHILGALTQYATIRRYEEGYEILTKEDVHNAIVLSEQIVHWAMKIII